MTRFVHQICLVLLLLVQMGVAWAADSQDGDIDKATIRNRFETAIQERQQERPNSQAGNLPAGQGPFAPGAVELNEENKRRQQESIGDYFTYIRESNEHQLRVFRWQLFSSKVIFVAVMALVASGIYFAAVQFHHGLRSGKGDEKVSEFEASIRGIKVSSPVLGVIILTISLAFFYLYLTQVYPIKLVE